MSRGPLPLSGRTTRQRTRCIEMRTIVNAHTQPVDEFTAEPPGDAAERKRHDFQYEQAGRWRSVGCLSPHQPDERKDEDDDDVGTAMQQSDPFRPRTGRNGKPVNQPEYRGEQATHDPRSDIPVCRRRKSKRIAPQVHGIEDDGANEESEWKDNQHRVNRMTQESG